MTLDHTTSFSLPSTCNGKQLYSFPLTQKEQEKKKKMEVSMPQ